MGDLMKGLMKDVQLDEVDEGIFSCLGKAERQSDYDSKVGAYDLVVGNRFYNRIVWGNWPANYRDFCRQALASTPGGIYLDAGCGSLVFTASVYAEADNKLIVLMDRSLGMLARGRDRIRKLRGSVPDNIRFLQGSIFDLPFREHVFDSVASYGVLHIFDDKTGMLGEMERVKRNSGQLFFSSLVGNNALGRKYLEILKKAGEVAECHSSESLARMLSATPFRYRIDTIGNMAYGRSA
jgi:ubiquinone/menaquinone biosynthesis C-methylase UbiE